MIWGGDLGLELYVATAKLGGSQHIESEFILEAIKSLGFQKRIEIVHLDSLARKSPESEYFEAMRANPSNPVRLPFLACMHGCETGAVLGYAGLENILEVLEKYV